MSRATHDFECFGCGAKGKIPDDVITCPECGASIEGQPVTGEAYEALKAKIVEKREIRIVLPSKEAKG